jgi:aminopeptidase 2
MCKKGETVGGGGAVSSYARELLPTNVRPTHYDLTLEPNLETLKYDGHVIIDLDVKDDSDSVSLNTLELELGEVKLWLDTASGEETVL